jgi:nicotinamide-nucleotide amidase
VSEPRHVVEALAHRGLRLATGESLTAGLVAATLADVPGCSAVLEGGVVAYQPDVKKSLLGVSDTALAAGVVSEPVARAMAEGARRAFAADVGVGTTGVAGPEPHDGSPVGTVWLAVATPDGTVARGLQLTGGREQIRRETVRACWDLILDALKPATGE